MAAAAGGNARNNNTESFIIIENFSHTFLGQPQIRCLFKYYELNWLMWWVAINRTDTVSVGLYARAMKKNENAWRRAKLWKFYYMTSSTSRNTQNTHTRFVLDLLILLPRYRLWIAPHRSGNAECLHVEKLRENNISVRREEIKFLFLL